MYLGLHVKLLIILPSCIRIWIFGQIYIIIPINKFHGNMYTPSGSRADTRGQVTGKHNTFFASTVTLLKIFVIHNIIRDKSQAMKADISLCKSLQ